MKRKMDSLQALRAVTCLSVFLNHCYVNTSGWTISVFVVLSGFLMVFTRYSRTDELSLSPIVNIRLAYSKMKGMYKLYIITLLPIVFLEIFSIVKGNPMSTFRQIIFEFIISVFMIQSWFSQHSMAFNGVAWYLSSALFLYFAFPYILRIIRKYKSVKTAWLVMTALFAVEFAVSAAAPDIWRFASKHFSVAQENDFILWLTLISPPFRLIDFALGCNLGYIFLQCKDKEPKKSLVISLDILTLVLFALSVFFFKANGYYLSQERFRHGLNFTPFALAAVYTFALARGRLPKLLTNKVTVFFGNLSNYFYLIHQDVIRFFLLLLTSAGMSFEVFRMVIIPIAFAVTMLLSMGYDRLVKRRKALRV